MRRVIFDNIANTITVSKADKRRLIAIVAGIVGVVINGENDGHWSVMYSNGHQTPDFPTLTQLVESLPSPFNIYEI